MNESEDKFKKAQKLRDNGQIDRAISLYENVRKEALENRDTQLAAESLHMIGVAYYQDKRYEEVEKTLKKSKQEFERDSNKEFAGFVLRDLGINARSNEELDGAEKLLKESIDVLVSVGNKGHEGISRVKLARVYADKDQFREALQYIEEGISLLEQGDEKFFLSSAYLDKAKVLKIKGDKNGAVESAKVSLGVLNSFASADEFLERRRDINKLLEEFE